MEVSNTPSGAPGSCSEAGLLPVLELVFVTYVLKMITYKHLVSIAICTYTTTTKLWPMTLILIIVSQLKWIMASAGLVNVPDV